MEYYVTLSPMKNVTQKETYNRSVSKRKYIVKFEESDKIGDYRGLVGGLLECLLRIRMFPVLVIAIDRKVEVETAKPRSKHDKMRRVTYSSSWIAHGRPNDELI